MWVVKSITGILTTLGERLFKRPYRTFLLCTHSAMSFLTCGDRIDTIGRIGINPNYWLRAQVLTYGWLGAVRLGPMPILMFVFANDALNKRDCTDRFRRHIEGARDHDL
jgi:hypothetical protein